MLRNVAMEDFDICSSKSIYLKKMKSFQIEDNYLKCETHLKWPHFSCHILITLIRFIRKRKHTTRCSVKNGVVFSCIIVK